MTFNKYIPSTFLLLFISSLSFGQYSYDEVNDIEVIKNSNTLKTPFTGGFSAAQFCEFDLNYDGTMDLIVYDRTQGMVRPYINLGVANTVSYEYSPEYAHKFPKLRSWLLTADYDNDGKMDLFDGQSGIQVWKNTGNSADGIKFEFAAELTTLYNTNSTKPIKLPSQSTSLPGIIDIDGDGDVEIFTINPNNGVTINYHRNMAVENGNPNYLDFERRNGCWGNFFYRTDTLFLDSCKNATYGLESNVKNPEDTTFEQTPDLGLKHGIRASITMVDYDGSGSTDILISIDQYKSKLYLNGDLGSNGSYVNSRIMSEIDSFPKKEESIDAFYPAHFFLDVNNDGKKDMIACANESNDNTFLELTKNEIFLYENVSTTNAIELKLIKRDFLLDETLDFGIGAYPVFFDYNKDGLMDLVIGNDGVVNLEDNEINGHLELFENIGTKQTPKFELVDADYLNLSNDNMNSPLGKSSRNLIPSFGDADGDGDLDMLLGDINSQVYLFEDTSINGSAAFKLRSSNFSGLNFRTRNQTNALFFYDINGDGLEDILASENSNKVNYFLNFGAKSDPVYNISLDSVVYISAAPSSFPGVDSSVYHYYLKDIPNYSLFNVGDELAVNSGSNSRNNAAVKLTILSINEQENYFECSFLSYCSASSPDCYEEFNSDGFINYYNRNWSDLSVYLDNLNFPRVFAYDNGGKNQLVVGNVSGEFHFYKDFSTTANLRDTLCLNFIDYLPNFGFFAFVNGADINDDGLVDLVVGNRAGGIKIMYASGVRNPVYETNPTAMRLGADSSNFRQFSITSDSKSWTISESSSWMKVSPDKGKFSSSITIEATEDNLSEEFRTDTIYIKFSSTLTKKVVVTQDTIGIVGLKDILFEEKIKLYPNPSTGEVNIDFGENNKLSNFRYEIINLLGKKIETSNISNQITSNGLKLDLSSLPTGIYFIRMRFNDQFAVKKVSIAH